jgi:tape measure domain-containing protein
MAGSKYFIPIVFKSDNKGVDQAESALKSLSKSVLAIGATAAAAAGAAGLGLLTTALRTGFSRLNEIDIAKNKLEGIGNSAEQVAGIMENALTAVKGTAFSLGEAATVASTAVAAGVQQGGDLERYLKTVADTASVAGVSLEEMGNTINGVRTIGAAYNDTLRELAEKGIPIYTILAEKLGVTTQEVKDLASEGEISAAIFEEALLEKFGGAALKAGETVQGSFANMQAALARLGAALLGTTFEELPTVFGQITEIFDELLPQFKELGEELAPVLIETFQVLLEAITPLLLPLAEIITALLPPLAGLIVALAPIVVKLINAFIPLVNGILPIFVALLDAIVPIIDVVIDVIIALLPIILELVEAFAPLALAILPVILELVKLLVPAIKAFGDSISFIIKNVVKPFIDALGVLVGWLGSLFGFSGKSVNVSASATAPAYRSGGIKLAEGGIVMPRPGGVQATIAEAGEAEAVIPLSKMGSLGTTVNIYGNVGYDANELAREIARRQRQTYSLTGVSRLVGVS